MAKKEQELYEGMPVIEAADQKALDKKLEKMAERPEKYAVRIPKTKTGLYAVVDPQSLFLIRQ